MSIKEWWFNRKYRRRSWEDALDAYQDFIKRTVTDRINTIEERLHALHQRVDFLAVLVDTHERGKNILVVPKTLRPTKKRRKK